MKSPSAGNRLLTIMLLTVLAGALPESTGAATMSVAIGYSGSETDYAKAGQIAAKMVRELI